MYDPIIETHPQPGQGHPNSYWARDVTLGENQSLETDTEAEVVIIGAGYTGLSAAYHLAKEHKVQATVIDANDIGWGCSGRNAGFVLPGTGRLSLLQIREKWGHDISQHMYHEFQDAIDTVTHLMQEGNIECDFLQGGYLRVAHKKELAEDMLRNVDRLQELFSQNVEYKSAEQIGEQFMQNERAFGAMYYPNGFALNPLKLVQGYAKLATQNAVKIHSNSPLIEWRKNNDKHHLLTPKGSITCKKVIIATNGYTGTRLHPSLKNRHFPVLSSIIVTRKLNQAELDALKLKIGLMVMDTRALKYYYRLLPDGRLLFGGRGAIRGKDANQQCYSKHLLTALIDTFPQLGNITLDYFWSGWVSVSYDDYPRIWGNEDDSVYYAMGYCGSGVSFATQAGKRLAQKVTKQTLPNIPIMQSSLSQFPFAPFRRVGLSLYYRWTKFKG
jgi:glycine/D-amino acid oxidase-like deaminating enzyme